MFNVYTSIKIKSLHLILYTNTHMYICMNDMINCKFTSPFYFSPLHQAESYYNITPAAILEVSSDMRT